MSNAIYTVSENQHQLLKSRMLKNVDSRIKIIYSGKKDFLNSKESADDFVSASKADIKNFNLSNAIAFIFFTLHGNEENFLLIKLLRKKNIPIICFQESHQLMVQKEKIFNIVLAPDLLISASDYESSLIIKNQLLAGHKLISPGWIFGNTLRERIKKLNQLLIIFGASDKIAPGSDESEDSKNVLISFLKSKFPEMEIHIKEHPQEFLYKSTKKFNNVKYVDYSHDVNSIHADYEMIYCSENTQASIDLMQIRDINLVSFNISGKIFNNINTDTQQIINSEIRIKEYKLSSHYKNILNIIQTTTDKSNIDMDMFISIANNNKNKHSNVKEDSLWESYFKDKDTDRILYKYFFKGNQSKTDYKAIRADLNEASQVAIIFLIEIKKILGYKITDHNQIQEFINEFLTPINIQNYILETLQIYLFIKKNNINVVFTKQNYKLIRNIYESLIYRLLLRFKITFIPKFLNFEHLEKNKLKIALFEMILFKLRK